MIGRGSYRSVLRMLGGTTVVIHLAACSEPEKSFTPQPADPGPAPTVLVNPRLLTLMQGQSAEVSVDGALEYEWMNLPPSGITVRPSAPENFRLEAWATVPAGTYRLMVSGRNCYHYGCTRDGVDTLTLIIESANGFPFSWDFCAGSRVAWFALRDGRDAPWVEVPVVGGGVDFELSEREVSFVAVIEEDARTIVRAADTSLDELLVPGSAPYEVCTGGPRRVDAVLRGADGASVRAALGNWQASEGPDGGLSWPALPVTPGLLTLLAVRTPSGADAPDRALIRRGIDLTAASDVEIDFTGGDAFSPENVFVEISVLSGMTALMDTEYFTPAGSLRMTSSDVPIVGPLLMFSVPTALRRVGDRQLLAIQVLENGVVREVFRGEPDGTRLRLQPTNLALSGATVGGRGHLSLTEVYVTQPRTIDEANNGTNVRIVLGAGTDRALVWTVSAGYIEDRSARRNRSYSHDATALSLSLAGYEWLPGWNPAWARPLDAVTEWEVWVDDLGLSGYQLEVAPTHSRVSRGQLFQPGG